MVMLRFLLSYVMGAAGHGLIGQPVLPLSDGCATLFAMDVSGNMTARLLAAAAGLPLAPEELAILEADYAVLRSAADALHAWAEEVGASDAG